MSFLPGGQPSTNKLVLDLCTFSNFLFLFWLYLILIPFPVVAGIISWWLTSREEGHKTPRKYMSFLFRCQLSFDKSIVQIVKFFIVQFPVWAGINFNSISSLGWNWFWFQPKPEKELSTCVIICVLTSCNLCQLITTLHRCRTYL